MINQLPSVTRKNFVNEVIRSRKPVLVLFGTSSSHHCKKIAPVLENISKRRSYDLAVVTVDMDCERGIPINYHIETIPSFILFKDGNRVKTRIGAIPENEIEAWIDS